MKVYDSLCSISAMLCQGTCSVMDSGYRSLSTLFKATCFNVNVGDTAESLPESTTASGSLCSYLQGLIQAVTCCFSFCMYGYTPTKKDLVVSIDTAPPIPEKPFTEVDPTTLKAAVAESFLSSRTDFSSSYFLFHFTDANGQEFSQFIYGTEEAYNEDSQNSVILLPMSTTVAMSPNNIHKYRICSDGTSLLPEYAGSFFSVIPVSTSREDDSVDAYLVTHFPKQDPISYCVLNAQTGQSLTPERFLHLMLEIDMEAPEQPNSYYAVSNRTDLEGRIFQVHLVADRSGISAYQVTACPKRYTHSVTSFDTSFRSTAINSCGEGYDPLPR
jgi:hypothetical protein